MFGNFLPERCTFYFGFPRLRFDGTDVLPHTFVPCCLIKWAMRGTTGLAEAKGREGDRLQERKKTRQWHEFGNAPSGCLPVVWDVCCMCCDRCYTHKKMWSVCKYIASDWQAFSFTEGRRTHCLLLQKLLYPGFCFTNFAQLIFFLCFSWLPRLLAELWSVGTECFLFS